MAGPFAGQVLAEAQNAGRLDELDEPGLAFLERQRAQVLAVEVEKVEGIKDGVRRLPFVRVGERLLKSGEARAPLSSSTTASPSRIAARTGRAATAFAIAGKRVVQSSPLRVFSCALPFLRKAMQPVAVPLDLVQPLRALRHRVDQGGEARARSRSAWGRTARPSHGARRSSAGACALAGARALAGGVSFSDACAFAAGGDLVEIAARLHRERRLLEDVGRIGLRAQMRRRPT